MTGNDVIKALEGEGIKVQDNRAVSPDSYVRRTREPEDIRAVVLHQTGFSWSNPDNPNWAKVRAHFVVRQDGSVVMNFAPTTQMRVGSYHANPFSITIEVEGNHADAQGKFFKPEKFGEDELADHPAQIASARALIRILHKLFPTITHVYAHRQWETKKGNCPGPEIWKAIGRWAIEEEGLTQGGAGWHYDDGLPLPTSWGEPEGGELPPDKTASSGGSGPLVVGLVLGGLTIAGGLAWWLSGRKRR